MRKRKQELESNHFFKNVDGSVRKVNRRDYSRGAKRQKADDPWMFCLWLQMLRNPLTANPTTRERKEFRRKFRVPHPVFVNVVDLCRATNEPELKDNISLIG